MNKAQMMRKGVEPNLVIVTFDGVDIEIKTVNNEKYVAMRTICNAIGLDWSVQYRKITSDTVLSEGVAIITTPYNNNMIFLKLDLLNGWLFGISENKVKPELKEKVLNYKRQCYAILANHFKPKQRLTLDYFKLPEEKSMKYELSYQVRDYHGKHIVNILKHLIKMFHSDYVSIEALGQRASENRVFQNNRGLFREMLFNSTIDVLVAEDIIEVNGSMIRFCSK